MSLPTVIGLCSDERCAEEFYMPDPKPGEGCPYCDRKLVHYKRTTYRLAPAPGSLPKLSQEIFNLEKRAT